MEWDVGNGLRELLPSPSWENEKCPHSWGLGLPLALGLDLKEKRLIRRREKLPAFFRTLGVVDVLERSSCDWLRPASFCRCLRRKMSLVPLRRKLTVGEEGRLKHRERGTKGLWWGREHKKDQAWGGQWYRTEPGPWPRSQASLRKKVKTKPILYPSWGKNGDAHGILCALLPTGSVEKYHGASCSMKMDWKLVLFKIERQRLSRGCFKKDHLQKQAWRNKVGWNWLTDKTPQYEQEGVYLGNFKEVNSNQYIEEGAYTVGFEFRNHIIPGSDAD